MRDVATEAGVDPALVSRNFGSKTALFLETLQVTDRYESLTSGPLATLGAAMLDRLYGVNGVAPRSELVAVMGALGQTAVREYLLDSMNTHIVGPLALRLAGSDTHLRAELIGAQLLGLELSWWVLAEEQALPLTQIVRYYGPAIQMLITPPQGKGGRIDRFTSPPMT